MVVHMNFDMEYFLGDFDGLTVLKGSVRLSDNGTGLLQDLLGKIFAGK